jgi:hypothetical protein
MATLLKLPCPRCETALGYDYSTVDQLFCHKCKRHFRHPLLERIFAAGKVKGESDKINEIRFALKLD